MEDMRNVTSQGISLELVYSNTIPNILDDILILKDNNIVYARGLSATVILMSYALVESKMWSSIVRLTNSDTSMTATKSAFLSDSKNWKYNKRKKFLLDEYQIDMTQFNEYGSLEYLANLRNFVAHGGDININRVTTTDDFKFSKDTFRQALLHFDMKYQTFFSGNTVVDAQKVDELVSTFLTYDFVDFYYKKVLSFLYDFEEHVCRKIPDRVPISTILPVINPTP